MKEDIVPVSALQYAKLLKANKKMVLVKTTVLGNTTLRTLEVRQWRTEGEIWGVQTPPRNSEGPPKSCQTQPDLSKLLKTAEFRTPTPQDVWEKGQ